MSSVSFDDERHGQSEPFLPPTGQPQYDGDPTAVSNDFLTHGQAWCLYTSHFLSMWNSRTYEYGAILFIQAAFPGSLLLSSINGIAETVCVLVSSSYLGHWVDTAPTRLRPLLLTIFTNRIALVVCCVLWLLLFHTTLALVRKSLFALTLIVGMVEKASRMANTLSMERDWIPILANAETEHHSLTYLNTAMRRIDITCKFAAPLTISSLVALTQPATAAAMIATVSLVSVGAEAWIVKRVWSHNNKLRTGRRRVYSRRTGAGRSHSPSQSSPLAFQDSLLAKSRRLLEFLLILLRANLDGLHYYCSTAVWVPSICAAVMHGSVLAWSGTLITWLLNEHFSLTEITIAKGVGSVFEIGSTLVFPWAVKTLVSSAESPGLVPSYEMVEQRDVDDGIDLLNHNTRDLVHGLDKDPTDSTQMLGNPSLHVAVIRLATWSIAGLFIVLVPATATLFILDHSIRISSTLTPGENYLSPLSTSGTTAITAISFWSFLSLSFLGRWTYDLAATQLTQMLVPSTHRAAFGGTEQAIVSMVSLIHWIAAAIWHKQKDFVWLALVSVLGVGVATAMFVRWATRISMNFDSTCGDIDMR